MSSDRRGTPWTPDEDACIQENYGKLSAAEISVRLAEQDPTAPPRSRPSIIARAGRLGLGKPRPRATPGERKLHTQTINPQAKPHIQKRVNKARRSKAPKRRPEFWGAEATAALQPKQCHYPLGDPGSPGFHYCCASTIPGSIYCAHHYKLCVTGRLRQ